MAKASIGARLKRWRIRQRKTLQEVADLLQVKPMTIWRWENGKAQPHDTNLYHLERLVAKEAA